MKKLLFSAFLIANSIGAYAAESLPIEANKNIERISCSKSVNSEQKVSSLDNEKLVFVSMDYYREYENKDHKLLKESLSNFTLVNNSSEPLPFGIYTNSRYLVSIRYKGQEINDGISHVDQNGQVKAIKYPFENKSLYGNIYTTIGSDNKVNMKVCMSKGTENHEGVNDKYSVYKESTVQFNEPTIIDLSNGYKVKVTLHKYKI